MLNKIGNWILLSSVDAEQGSLTAKGFLIAAVPTIMYFLGLTHVQVDSQTLTMLIDTFFGVIQAVLVVAASLVTFVGVARKIYLTATGQNAPVPEEPSSVLP